MRKIALVGVLATLVPVCAQAHPNSNWASRFRVAAARAAVEEVVQAENYLKRKLSKLDNDERAALATLLRNSRYAPYYQDSDSDGVNDISERFLFESNLCQSDSDGDGIGDGDEIANGTDPNTPESGGETPGEGDPLTAHATIAVFTGTRLVLGGIAFTLTDSTQYVGTDVGSLAAGQCVEVHGHVSGDFNLADSIAAAEGC